jgi:hypothetical protein
MGHFRSDQRTSNWEKEEALPKRKRLGIKRWAYKAPLVEMRKLSSNHFEDPKGSFRAFLDSFFYRQVRNKSPSVISVTQELYRVKGIG